MLRCRVDVASASKNNVQLTVRVLFILARELAREAGDRHIVQYYQQGLSEIVAVLWHVLDAGCIDQSRSPTHDEFSVALSAAAVEADWCAPRATNAHAANRATANAAARSYWMLRALLLPIGELFFTTMTTTTTTTTTMTTTTTTTNNVSDSPILLRCNAVGSLLRRLDPPVRMRALSLSSSSPPSPSLHLLLIANRCRKSCGVTWPSRTGA